MVVSRKNLLKAVSILTLASVISAALIGLALLFGIIEGSDTVGKILLSILTVFVAGILGFNSINAITKGNKISIVAGFSLILSVLLFIVLIWLGDFLGDFYDAYIYIVVIVSMLSVFLNVMIANYVALGKSLLVVQIIFDVLFAYILIAISLVIFGNTDLLELWQIFVADVIVVLALYGVLKIKGKNIAQKETEIKASDGYITIEKTVYEEMKAEIERLKALLEEKNLTPLEEKAEEPENK